MDFGSCGLLIKWNTGNPEGMCKGLDSKLICWSEKHISLLSLKDLKELTSYSGQLTLITQDVFVTYETNRLKKVELEGCGDTEA